MAEIKAIWVIELNCNCPGCGKHVDLTNNPDFYDGKPIEIGEHETERTTNMEASCPECGYEFFVDCLY